MRNSLVFTNEFIARTTVLPGQAGIGLQPPWLMRRQLTLETRPATFKTRFTFSKTSFTFKAGLKVTGTRSCSLLILSDSN
jgi:hypothetical protein